MHAATINTENHKFTAQKHIKVHKAQTTKFKYGLSSNDFQHKHVKVKLPSHIPKPNTIGQQASAARQHKHKVKNTRKKKTSIAHTKKNVKVKNQKHQNRKWYSGLAVQKQN